MSCFGQNVSIEEGIIYDTVDIVAINFKLYSLKLSNIFSVVMFCSFLGLS